MKASGSFGCMQKVLKGFTVALFCRQACGVNIGQALGIISSGSVKGPMIVLSNQHAAVHKRAQKLMYEMLLSRCCINVDIDVHVLVRYNYKHNFN
jgi:hypothetical protein